MNKDFNFHYMSVSVPAKSEKEAYTKLCRRLVSIGTLGKFLYIGVGTRERGTMKQLTTREKKLLSTLLTLRAETANCAPSVGRWQSSERRKAEKRADKVITEFTEETPCFTFQNVLVSIPAKDGKEAYAKLCDALSKVIGTGRYGDFQTTTYSIDGSEEKRSTQEIFP